MAEPVANDPPSEGADPPSPGDDSVPSSAAPDDGQIPPPDPPETPGGAAGDPGDRVPETPDGDRISGRLALSVIAAFGLVLVASLVTIAWSSHAHYSQGIEAVIAHGANADHATVVARRVFLLASGNQIVLFKAIAYGMAIMLALAGIVLVLNGAKAVYSLTAGNPKAGVSQALTTTSPGLVVITLAAALAGGTLASKSSLQDHRDWDLRVNDGSHVADILGAMRDDKAAPEPDDQDRVGDAFEDPESEETDEEFVERLKANIERERNEHAE